MDRLSLDHLGKPANPLYGLDQRCIVISKIFRPSDFGFRVTMERPSGDQCGENMPTDWGSVVTWLPSSSNADYALWIVARLSTRRKDNLPSVWRPVRISLRSSF